jgi:RNA polymerase sigma-70 factor, ECF subfamily
MEQRFEPVLSTARAEADWAWAELYRELSPAVLGYFRARRASDPEDLLGEVFLQVVRDISSFDGDEGSFRAWVFTIAHHRLLDAARSQRRRPRIDPGATVAEYSLTGDSEEEALVSLADQETAAMIARLSPDQQSVLLLRILGDFTVDQVAQIVGKRPNAVKALQRRGLAALRRRIGEAVTL